MAVQLATGNILNRVLICFQQDATRTVIKSITFEIHVVYVIYDVSQKYRSNAVEPHSCDAQIVVKRIGFFVEVRQLKLLRLFALLSDHVVDSILPN